MIDLSKPWWKWSAKCYFIEGRDVVALAKELERQKKPLTKTIDKEPQLAVSSYMATNRAGSL